MARLPVEEQIAIVREAGYAGIELVSDPQGSLDARSLDGAGRSRWAGSVTAEAPP